MMDSQPVYAILAGAQVADRLQLAYSPTFHTEFGEFPQLCKLPVVLNVVQKQCTFRIFGHPKVDIVLHQGICHVDSIFQVCSIKKGYGLIYNTITQRWCRNGTRRGRATATKQKYGQASPCYLKWKLHGMLQISSLLTSNYQWNPWQQCCQGVCIQP